MRVKRNILIFIAVIIFICTALAFYFIGYSVAKQEDKVKVETTEQ